MLAVDVLAVDVLVVDELVVDVLVVVLLDWPLHENRPKCRPKLRGGPPLQGVDVVDVVVELPPQVNRPCPDRQAPGAKPGRGPPRPPAPPKPPTLCPLLIWLSAALAWAAVSLPAFWAALI